MIKFTILAIFALVLSAWQRQAANDCMKANQKCQKEVARCKQDGGPTSYECRNKEEKCKNEMTGCKKDAPSKDRASFSSSLNPQNRKLFKDFSVEQKKKAMDYSDHHAMSPDEAVVEVASSARQRK